MSRYRTQASALVASAALALLLAACGGGDPDVPGSVGPSGAPTTKGNFTTIVSFGTSPSDVGTYAPASSLTGNGQPPFFGGRFTTNSATGTVWVENLAVALGITLTAAEIGFNGSSVPCPAQAINPALSATCTAYGQGGARITNPNGVGRDPVTGAGALTVPLARQIDNHLARFTTFKSTDLIFVEGGLNDLFVQFQTFGAAAAQIQARAASGAISADEANRQLFAAQTAAQAEMKTAALELAGYVKDKILARGGRYVAVATIPDLANTPFGKSPQVAPAVSVATALTDTFNLWLREGLANQPVQLLDLRNFFNDAVANPTKYGLANVAVPACDAAKISVVTGGQVTTGSSLFCNATPGAPFNGLRTGADVTTWLFADDVHPTTRGHQLIFEYANAQLRAFGWI